MLIVYRNSQIKYFVCQFYFKVKHIHNAAYFCATMKKANNTSQHILNTSANLLGFCLFVITSYNVTNKAETSIIDDFTAAIALLLVFSCLFSFLSIRNEKQEKLEIIADYLFLASLFGIVIIVVLIAFNIIK